ncbi:MAG TPA: hypothetical protein VFX15_05795 [Actinomycetes bacterium]|nr:hypothetical protein [Actinomycetes bacterium]
MISALVITTFGPYASGDDDNGTPDQPQVELRYGTTADRVDSSPLQGSLDQRKAYYVFAVAKGAESVTFWLDLSTSATPTQVEHEAPYDLLGGTGEAGRPLLLDDLGTGDHRVVALAVFEDGTKVKTAASFSIERESLRDTSDGDGDGDARQRTSTRTKQPRICQRKTLPGPLQERPRAHNTGVPPRADLRVVDGNYHTRRAGQVVSNLLIKGDLFIDHNRVKVRCTRVKGMTTNNGTGLRMWSSSLGVRSGIREGSALKWRDYTLRRVDIFGTFDGLKAEGNVDVRDSYIHDLFRTTDETQDNGWTHNDAVQIGRGSNMKFVHNTIFAWSFGRGERAGEHLLKSPYGNGEGYMTSAFMITDGLGPVRDVLIKRNLIRGRTSKHIYVLRSVRDVEIRHNRFGRENREFPKIMAVNRYTTVAQNSLIPRR